LPFLRPLSLLSPMESPPAALYNNQQEIATQQKSS